MGRSANRKWASRAGLRRKAKTVAEVLRLDKLFGRKKKYLAAVAR